MSEEEKKPKTHEVFGILVEGEAEVRERRGFHQLVFKDDMKRIDGKEITMCNEGWNAITKVYGTMTPAVLVPRLSALHIGLASGKLKILSAKEYEELLAKIPKPKENQKKPKEA